MAGREIVKNIKPVFCRFDMDNEQERRAWQILQGSYQEPPDGKKQDYRYYDREGKKRRNKELSAH